MIGLPSSLFYGTGIPAALLIINKQKSELRRGKVLFINAELDYEKRKKQNYLRDVDIEKILNCFNSYEVIKGFSKIITFEEIRQNEFNLNFKKYFNLSSISNIVLEDYEDVIKDINEAKKMMMLEKQRVNSTEKDL